MLLITALQRFVITVTFDL